MKVVASMSAVAGRKSSSASSAKVVMKNDDLRFMEDMKKSKRSLRGQDVGCVCSRLCLQGMQ